MKEPMLVPNNQLLRFEFSAQEFNIVMESLTTQPFFKVKDLITKLDESARSQIMKSQVPPNSKIVDKGDH